MTDTSENPNAVRNLGSSARITIDGLDMALEIRPAADRLSSRAYVENGDGVEVQVHLAAQDDAIVANLSVPAKSGGRSVGDLRLVVEVAPGQLVTTNEVERVTVAAGVNAEVDCTLRPHERIDLSAANGPVTVRAILQHASYNTRQSGWVALQSDRWYKPGAAAPRVRERYGMDPETIDFALVGHSLYATSATGTTRGLHGSTDMVQPIHGATVSVAALFNGVSTHTIDRQERLTISF